MPQIGPLEIAVVLLIALLVFGPNRLPELARQVGGALRELKRIQGNLRADLHEMMADESDGAAPPPTLPPKVEGAPEVVDVTGSELATPGRTAETMAEAELPPPPPPPDPD